MSRTDWGTIPDCTDASTPPSLLVSLLKDDVISASCVPLVVVAGNAATAVEVDVVVDWTVRWFSLALMALMSAGKDLCQTGGGRHHVRLEGDNLLHG
jgi:hypothetical protein